MPGYSSRPGDWFDLQANREPEPAAIEAADAIDLALDVLTVDERAVITEMWLIHDPESNGPQHRPGASLTSVARQLGMSRSTVRKTEARAFRKMATALAQSTDRY